MPPSAQPAIASDQQVQGYQPASRVCRCGGLNALSLPHSASKTTLADKGTPAQHQYTTHHLTYPTLSHMLYYSLPPPQTSQPRAGQHDPNLLWAIVVTESVHNSTTYTTPARHTQKRLSNALKLGGKGIACGHMSINHSLTKKMLSS